MERFADISRVLSVTEATAEVYTIDSYCAGAPIEFAMLSEQMNLSSADVEILCNGIKGAVSYFTHMLLRITNLKALGQRFQV